MGTTVRNKRVPVSGFMGIFATEDRDEKLKTNYRGLSREGCEAYLVTLTRQMLFSLFFWSTRDPSSLFKSMYEEHLCVVALTSSERGTQFY